MKMQISRRSRDLEGLTGNIGLVAEGVHKQS